MDYVMDMLAGLEVEELIFITGHLKELVERYVTTHYPIRARFVEQRTLDGTAGAVNLARPWVDGPVFIIFVDTLFEADLSLVRTSDVDGILWAKEVEDYQRFGVIVTDAAGFMTRIVEKPDTPISKLAVIGPNVSLGAESKLIGSTVVNSILGRRVRLNGATVTDSLVGDDQVIEGKTVMGSVLDAGELAPAR